MNNIAPITSARLSHDGNCILVSTLDDTVRLMDKANGTLLNEYVFFLLETCYIISSSERNGN